MLLSSGSHDQSKESAWDSHFIEPITSPCSRDPFFSPNKTVSRKKTEKLLFTYRRTGCPLLGATKKTCKIRQLPQFPHITSNNCKLGECVRWGGGGRWLVSGSGKGVQNLTGL